MKLEDMSGRVRAAIDEGLRLFPFSTRSERRGARRRGRRRARDFLRTSVPETPPRRRGRRRRPRPTRERREHRERVRNSRRRRRNARRMERDIDVGEALRRAEIAENRRGRNRRRAASDERRAAREAARAAREAERVARMERILENRARRARALIERRPRNLPTHERINNRRRTAESRRILANRSAIF